MISYEAGFKAETADRRFSLDAAVFHIDWKDIQLFAQINGFGVNANGGKAKSNGVEFTAPRGRCAASTCRSMAPTPTRKLTDDTPRVWSAGGTAIACRSTPKFSAGAERAIIEWALGGDDHGLCRRLVPPLSSQIAGYDR